MSRPSAPCGPAAGCVAEVEAIFWPRLPRKYRANRPSSYNETIPGARPLTPRSMIAALAVGAALIMPAVSQAAVPCGTGTFEAWLADFKTDAAYGVPAEVIVAIWGLETDFGANNGKFPTIRSLATLAYDCRRSDEFRAELMDALRIIERGDIAPADLKGAWAGEIGQTQFMPSSYIKYAVDFDGNGHSDLLHSVPDVLASTANYFAGHGWQKGKGYDPGSPNFAVIQQWNKSEIYAKTIAYFATQLAHAP